jgi:hypothetical protein
MWWLITAIALGVACIELLSHWERKRDRRELDKLKEYMKRNDEA